MFKSLFISVALFITFMTPIHLKAMPDEQDRSKAVVVKKDDTEKGKRGLLVRASQFLSEKEKKDLLVQGLQLVPPLLKRLFQWADYSLDKGIMMYCMWGGGSLGWDGSIYCLQRLHAYHSIGWHDRYIYTHGEPWLAYAVGIGVGFYVSEELNKFRHKLFAPSLSKLGGFIVATSQAAKTFAENTATSIGNWGKSTLESWTERLLNYANRKKAA